jgi:exopolysaccharide biosynthesis polyprenyl glycosylphosphotransferase
MSSTSLPGLPGPVAVAATAVEPAGPQALSAVSPSLYDVPERFLWLIDALICALALPAAWAAVPLVQPWLVAEYAGQFRWLRWVNLQPAAAVLPLQLDRFLWLPLIAAPPTLLFMHVIGGYRSLLEQSRTKVVAASVLAPIVGLSAATLALMTARNFNTSRTLIFLYTVVTAGGFMASRLAIRLYKRRRLEAGQYTRNVVLAADPAARAALLRHFAAHVPPQIRRVYGYLELRPEPAGAGEGDLARPDPSTPRPPRLGSVHDLGDLLVHRPIHEVVVVTTTGAEEWIESVIDRCEYFRITLRLVPASLLLRPEGNPDLTFRRDALALPEVELRPRSFSDEALFAKRLLDIVVSGTLLVLLLPLFAIVAAAIKITTPDLPVFYPWRVVGYKGRRFTGYKFTTMVADADDRKADLMHLNEMTGPVFKIRNDPRMTPVGKWLRRFSINELPQLWSVLKGDMSLVGPRPAYPTELARYELWQKRKLCVQPGITCIWQIRGRNRIASFDDWVRMDFEYIDNWSLWLDVRIIARTVLAVVRGTGS